MNKFDLIITIIICKKHIRMEMKEKKMCEIKLKQIYYVIFLNDNNGECFIFGLKVIINYSQSSPTKRYFSIIFQRNL